MKHGSTRGGRLASAAGLALGLLFAAAGVRAEAVYRLSVDGLACPFCAYGVERKLAAVAGVARVETGIASGTVTVTMAEDARLDEASARQAVKEAGFRLRAFKAQAPAGAGEKAD